jgi:argininosuccinate lyase
VVELAFGADAVFLAGFTGFQVAQAAEFAFHRDAHAWAISTTLRVTSTL